MIATSFLLSSVITILSILVVRWKRGQSLPASPPSPSGLPIIGNLHQLGSLPRRSLASLARSHGPLFRISLGPIPVFVVSSAELAQEVTKAQDSAFASRPSLSIPNRLLYGSRDIAFAPYGHHWRQTKKLCVEHLLSRSRVQSFRTVREQEIALLLSKIRSSDSAAVGLTPLIVTFTNDVVCRVVLGKKYADRMDFHDMLKENLSLLGSFPVRDYIPWLFCIDHLSGLNGRVRRNSEEVDAFLEKVLDDHRMGGGEDKQEDFVDVLLTLKQNNDIHTDVLKAVIWNMFGAGTDTTSSTTEWAMTNLIGNRSCMRKAQEEIRRVTGSKNIVNEEATDQMEYLKAIIKETLRLHPPSPLLLREARHDSKLNGYEVPTGARVFVNAWMIARDPEHWIMPEKFCPERFLNAGGDFKGQDYHMLPFGAGRRICPGMAFAVRTSQLVLANLLHFFDWEIPEERRAKVLEMAQVSGVTIRKKFGVWLRAKPHKFN